MEIRICPRGHGVTAPDLVSCPKCGASMAGAEVREVPDPPGGGDTTTAAATRPPTRMHPGILLIMVGAFLGVMGGLLPGLSDDEGSFVVAVIGVTAASIFLSIGVVSIGVTLGIRVARKDLRD